MNARVCYFAAPPGRAGGVVGAGAGLLEVGAEPVVVAGGAFVVAVCGPEAVVPAHHQIPRPIRTTTMMPIIQPPPESALRIRGRLLGSYVDMAILTVRSDWAPTAPARNPFHGGEILQSA